VRKVKKGAAGKPSGAQRLAAPRRATSRVKGVKPAKTAKTARTAKTLEVRQGATRKKKANKPKKPKKAAAKKAATRTAARKPTPKSVSTPSKAAAARDTTFHIRALDPQQKCGPGTSVQELYRVEEIVERDRTLHLVFFDRHGWYCLHGRSCPAVEQARKFGAHARRQESHGPTHNGRMRA
jgi:hypothetical protein